MTPFTTLTAVAAPLPQPNIDTDVIMPKQFLKRITRDGLAEGVFHDLRFRDGRPDPAFVLNRSPWDRAQILVCGDNFGCGSSREYAVWGLVQLGIRAIVAPSFAGIFYGNCEMNGLLAVTLPAHRVETLLGRIANPATAELIIDLLAQEVRTAGLPPMRFEIGAAHKNNLLTGADHVNATLRHADATRLFEAKQNADYPWLWTRASNARR